MSFMSNLKETLDENSFYRTENGALGFSRSGSNLLDMNFKVTSFRNQPDSAIENAFSKAYYEDKLLAVKWLFFARDREQGIGERRLFRVCMRWLATEQPEIVKSLIPLIPEYGRWDDLYCLDGTKCENDMYSFMKQQVLDDMKEIVNDQR